jgi:hypothetical protein
MAPHIARSHSHRSSTIGHSPKRGYLTTLDLFRKTPCRANFLPPVDHSHAHRSLQNTRRVATPCSPSPYPHPFATPKIVAGSSLLYTVSLESLRSFDPERQKTRPLPFPDTSPSVFPKTPLTRPHQLVYARALLANRRARTPRA